MEKELLAVKGLSVSVEDKPILDHVNLEIGAGETHVLMGPNGTGKSTLGYTLIGSPRYHVTEGQIMFKGKDITHMAANERAKLGMFLSFQAPLEVPGVTLGAFIRNAVELQTGSRLRLWSFKKELERAMELLVTTNTSTKDIAAAVGYYNHRYFYSVFKAKTGMTATEYRKAQREAPDQKGCETQ